MASSIFLKKRVFRKIIITKIICLAYQMPPKVILTSKKMKTPKFILNRTEDYLYHSKLWIIGYASLFYLCSIIIFSMLLTFCVFIYNCIGLDPETMTNFGGDPTYLKKSNDNLHFLLSVLVTAPLCEELIFRLGLSSKRKIFFL